MKIDRSFMTDIETNDYARRLVGGMAALAGFVGLGVSAEGVETAGQAHLLRELGCTSAHGFYFCGAVPAHVFTTLLGHHLRRLSRPEASASLGLAPHCGRRCRPRSGPSTGGG